MLSKPIHLLLNYLDTPISEMPAEQQFKIVRNKCIGKIYK